MLLYSSNSKEMLYELWVRTNCKFIFSWGSALCFSGTVVYFLGSHSKFTAFRLTGSPTGDSFLWRSCEDHIPGLFLPSGYYSARETAGLNMWIWILEILWPLVTFILPHLFKPTILWSIYPYSFFLNQEQVLYSSHHKWLHWCTLISVIILMTLKNHRMGCLFIVRIVLYCYFFISHWNNLWDTFCFVF